MRGAVVTLGAGPPLQTGPGAKARRSSAMSGPRHYETEVSRSGPRDMQPFLASTVKILRSMAGLLRRSVRRDELARAVPIKNPGGQPGRPVASSARLVQAAGS